MPAVSIPAVLALVVPFRQFTSIPWKYKDDLVDAEHNSTDSEGVGQLPEHSVLIQLKSSLFCSLRIG